MNTERDTTCVRELLSNPRPPGLNLNQRSALVGRTHPVEGFKIKKKKRNNVNRMFVRNVCINVGLRSHFCD